ncbi:hypothetical protein [Tomitella gaofuii]|uniref:hypothetical protein n=1 Tax=Tomitella gaofuii TaxID=2760083 RepID=UPI0015F990FF|nr:hypothetical protein [Tomitella gaofuii]
MNSSAQHKAQDLKDSALEQAHAAQDTAGHLAARARDAATDEHGTLKSAVPSGGVLIVVLAALCAVAVVLRARRR